MPADLVKLDGFHAGMSLNRDQGVRGLYGSMLAGVTGKNQPSPVLSYQPNQGLQLVASDLPGFVDHNKGAFRDFLFH